MNIRIFSDFKKEICKERIEMVERKGIGHPDSLADLIADDFSARYSKYCLRKFGVVLNHWVDKIVLAGGKSSMIYGKYRIYEPIRIYLFGKVTKKLGNEVINVRRMFEDSVNFVFMSVFKNKDILRFIRFSINVTDGIGFDHSNDFYSPKSKESLIKIKDMKVSNDTVIISAYSPYSLSELFSIKLEKYLNSNYFKKAFPETGYDIKVVVVRENDFYYITICIPFLAEETINFPFYKERLELIKRRVILFTESFLRCKDFDVKINTKDVGEYGYLTIFGTSLDKGDCGVVGRGNRYNGLISINREINLEAVSGKNPVCHSGKLYNIIAQRIANDVYSKFRVENYVNIFTRNGDHLKNPALVIVKFFNPHFDKENKDIIENIVFKNIENIDKIYYNLIKRDVIKDFYKLKVLVRS